MVIFRDPHGHRMITTPVRRLLGEPTGKRIYVETENSVYRLEIHGEPLYPMRTPAVGIETPTSNSSNSSSAR
ncbi:MAG: hypothetical protein Tsb0020_10370 [Haliangiales bacterium]